MIVRNYYLFFDLIRVKDKVIAFEKCTNYGFNAALNIKVCYLRPINNTLCYYDTRKELILVENINDITSNSYYFFQNAFDSIF